MNACTTHAQCVTTRDIIAGIVQDDPPREQDRTPEQGRASASDREQTVNAPGVVVTERPQDALRRARRQLLSAIIVAVLSTAAAVGSILGQGIAYRQMRATESIARTIADGCRR